MRDHRSIRIAAGVLGTAGLAFVAYATLSPIEDRPHVGSQVFEHLAAGAGLAFLFALAFPRHRLPIIAAALIVVPFLEIGQEFVPGRHARLSDIAWKLFGGVGGLLASYMAEDILARSRLRR